MLLYIGTCIIFGEERSLLIGYSDYCQNKVIVVTAFLYYLLYFIKNDFGIVPISYIFLLQENVFISVHGAGKGSG